MKICIIYKKYIKSLFLSPVFRLCLLTLYLLAAALPQSALASESTSIVQLPIDAPIYAEPSFDAQVIGSAQNGITINILEISGDWARISSGALTGYMPRNTIATLPDAADGEPSAAILMRINNAQQTDRLPLRLVPDEKSEIIAAYSNGVVVTLLDDPEEIAGAAGRDIQPQYVKVRVGDEPSALEGYMDAASLVPVGAGSGSALSGGDGGDGDGAAAQKEERVELRTCVLVVSNTSALDWLNLREQPSALSRALGQYGNGTPVEVLGVMSDWFHVRVDGQTGFMMASYLSHINDMSFIASQPLTLESGHDPITMQLIDTGAINAFGNKTGILRILDDYGYERQTIAFSYAGALLDEDTFIIEDINFDEIPDFRVCTLIQDNNRYYDYWLYSPSLVQQDAERSGDSFGAVGEGSALYEKAGSYGAIEGSPIFDAASKRLYSVIQNDDSRYTEYTYDIADGAPRLIEATETELLSDTRRRRTLWQVISGELTPIRSWDEDVP
ncbi:MAG: SH3 domain-containing protein [Oscillospiraceae bacterium]|jgi:SH3-like domain-containing protein|nr:SH3 domain-containing protein [Oscillospiraceae bacterium]